MVKNTRRNRRGQPIVLLTTTVVALLISSLPMAVPAVAQWHHNQMINSLSYKQTHGFWETVNIPSEFKTNTVHAAALPTGKILLVAGSGNNRTTFNTYHDSGTIAVLKTALFDPVTSKVTLIPTPSDLFCSGHTLLQSGNLLVAGGTSGYEVLAQDVKKPGGPMVIHNEDPQSALKTFKKGTRFINSKGHVYVSTQDAFVPPATKMDHGNGDVMIMPSSVKVFVEAVAEDTSYVTTVDAHYNIEGLTGSDTHNIYGQGGPMTTDKQDFRGDNKSYEFDPISESYVRVGDLNVSRWYASLPLLSNGDVLAVSGLDNVGKITDTTETFSPVTKKWTLGPNRALPTYPALFRTSNPKVLFFSGSSAGYGPKDTGREPGFWNIDDNSFHPVSGLRNTDILETSASIMLPPTPGSNNASQNNKVMLAGGGGVGESPVVTARTDIIDLSAVNPHYTPGPDLPAAVRYLNMTVTPWDTVFATGGSSDYRAKGNSYVHKAYSIDATKNAITPLADEPIGRTYHSGSVLLRDGRILVFGGDPLYGNKDNTAPSTFEQGIEIFTPPQFFRGNKPQLAGADNQVVYRGQQLAFTSTNASTIKTARLIPPSSATHVTNIEQRSVAAVVHTTGNNVSISMPADTNVLPSGWYMLFVTNNDGIPSYSKMIQVID
jgi:hypothetical protein